ncbi:unnamed protein product [Menidia menidia]|uniref:(Atlantic silverside) hypothetical protein n=1 Tax=Menidia menidia TaxID=238744 RepID=A0A8S4BT19_9TELE|nr:unnamed protein product [Menidia menidia]
MRNLLSKKWKDLVSLGLNEKFSCASRSSDTQRPKKLRLWEEKKEKPSETIPQSHTHSPGWGGATSRWMVKIKFLFPSVEHFKENQTSICARNYQNQSTRPEPRNYQNQSTRPEPRNYQNQSTRYRTKKLPEPKHQGRKSTAEAGQKAWMTCGAGEERTIPALERSDLI